ncbi:hypothetical protein EON81_30055 [bacterium]|nr:MAG: hypothetical protein EON81_30055 [bacterium]
MSFLQTVWMTFGIVSGLTFALGLVLAWTIHAGPYAEMLYERMEKPGVLPEEPKGEGLYSIIVSDLHLDTWDYENGETHKAFADFVDWMRTHPKISDLYINGDILDIPPHPLNQRR